MQNYLFLLQYEGTRYRGWQVQGNTEQTIQGKLEQVLTRMTGVPVEVHGSGRTDAGVHALGQCANAKLDTALSCAELRLEMNRYLPEDIAVIEVRPVPPRFHARLSAIRKTYRYRIWNSAVPNVLERRQLYQVPEPLNLAAMDAAAQYFIGTHDFRSFCGLKRFQKSTVRTITSIELVKENDTLSITFTGDGFLNRMVRILTGTLLEVGLGQRTPDEMPAILAACDRTAAGSAVPPQGLVLLRVDYP